MNRLILLLIAAGLFAATAWAQAPVMFDNAEDTRAALAKALAERRAAEARSAQFEKQASEAEDAAERYAAEAAATAAQIQQAEAGIAAANARIAMIDRERHDLREEIGTQQRPVVRLTAALQKFTRRPVALAVLRPGSVKDVVYLRALMHDAVPQVRERTQGLRDRIARGRELRREQLAAANVLATEETDLAARRKELAELETSQRLAARAAGSTANREADRALALAEQARDLDGLVDELDRAATLRSELAALPGPVLRPPRPREPGAAGVELFGAANADAAAGPAQPDGPSPYILPVTGRLVTGFGASDGARTSTGLTLAPIAGAQVVAPGAGRIAFAGAYRGYGRIVIVEHAGGWTSLVTGLARADAKVGDQVAAGAPLGVAGPGRPTITLELRKAGEPVNPLRLTE
ncbi:murein hydrolase activator EnvC family protein [Aurantiacibacter suaedae]|uniref:murein hydrolase activator EnvC family protein n=1 Tax=Aurantiacibacter suaedae TaxID=2545755 RepID=UPI0010F77E3D|nr:peptidoglycan DD-metalloendopeptidase family protein [Aurantiacibacter suaedae]